MNKFLWFLLSLGSPLFCTSYDLEVRGAYFYPTDSDLNSIFSYGGPCVQGQFTVRNERYLGFWGNVDYAYLSGTTVALDTKTNLQMVTGSFGPFVYYSRNKNIYPYLGVGPVFGFAHSSDYDPYLPSSVNKGFIGVIGKVGLKAIPKEHFVVEIFFDYAYQPVKTSYYPALPSKWIDTGGIKTGIGVGYEF